MKNLGGNVVFQTQRLLNIVKAVKYEYAKDYFCSSMLTVVMCWISIGYGVLTQSMTNFDRTRILSVFFHLVLKTWHSTSKTPRSMLLILKNYAC